MKNFKLYIIAFFCLLVVSSCEDKGVIPMAENAAYPQFERASGVVTATPTTNTTFSRGTLSKATPATTDVSTLKITGSDLVASVKVMVDYKKGAAIKTAQYKEITTYPLTITTSLNELIALFASQGVTTATVAATDVFVFRTVITLKTGSVVSEQSATLATLPYLTTLTYTVVN